MHRDRAAAGKGQCRVFVDRPRGRYRVDRRGVAIADNDIEAIGGRGIAGSVAVTFTVMVPTSLFPGVPRSLRRSIKWSQLGSAAPLESVAP